MPNRRDPKSNNRECVAVVGTGNYGISLGRGLMASDYNVTYGSRRPNLDYLKLCFESCAENYSVASIGQALLEADKVVFLAIPAWDSVYENIVDEIKQRYEEFSRRNKPLILIDISNSLDDTSKSNVSNAEKLNGLVRRSLPNLRISVVKGFNLLSAYAIGQDRFANKSALTGG